MDAFPFVVLGISISALLLVESRTTGFRLGFGIAQVGNSPLG
jgi:hypothetical protein